MTTMTMTIMIVLTAYAIGMGVSFVLITGWLFAEIRERFEQHYSKLTHREYTSCRSDAGFSILMGAIFSLVWLLGLPAVYLLTGFAEHGWKRPRLKPVNKEKVNEEKHVGECK